MIDFATLEAAWRSSANNPSDAARTYLAQDLASTLKRRRRATDGMLIFAGVMLALVVGRVLLDVLTGRASLMTLLEEWAIFPLLALPVILLIVLLRSRRSRGAVPDARTPLAHAFRAALAENADTRRRLQIIFVGQLLTAPLLAAGLMQLGASGKMAPNEQLSAAVLLGGALATAMVVVAVRYFTAVVPEGRHLEGLLREYKA